MPSPSSRPRLSGRRSSGIDLPARKPSGTRSAPTTAPTDQHADVNSFSFYLVRSKNQVVQWVAAQENFDEYRLFAVEGVASVGRTSREAAAAGAGRCGCCSSASARWLTMPDRNAAPKLTKSAATATTTIVHIRPASTSPPASAGSRVRASSTIAMKGMTPLIAPITLKAMMPARLRAPGRRTTPASSRRRFVPHPSRLPRTVESDRS